MRYIFILLIALVSHTSVTLAQTSISTEERQRLMSLDFEAFDQDMNGGWRTYGNQLEFELAAGLIEEYMTLHPEIEEGQLSVMKWHTGQMYALADKNEKAIPFMEASKKEEDVMSWNTYVDATIAFLKKDKDGLIEKRKELEKSSMMPADSNKNLILIKKLEANLQKTYLEAIRSQ